MKRAFIVNDMTFGDAGKGTMTDYFTRTEGAKLIVRYNGGAQAAHNVVTPEGLHHTFAQIGSGSFVPDAQTYLSRYVIVNPLNLLNEAEHFTGPANILERVWIDPQAPIVTAIHRAMNRLRELARGGASHGSCGQGIGEVQKDILDNFVVIRAEDLYSLEILTQKLKAIAERNLYEAVKLGFAPDSTEPRVGEAMATLLHSPAMQAQSLKDASKHLNIADSDNHLRSMMKACDTVVFEGSQGVLLDEWHGFHPYTTWSTTTFANALTLLRETCYSGDIKRVGVFRGYTTRHGYGPFPTEDDELTMAFKEDHNKGEVYMGDFRVGHFDMVLAKYALECTNGVDMLAFTNMDRLIGRPYKWATEYAGPVLKANFSMNLGHQERMTRHLMKDTKPSYRHFKDGSPLTIEDVRELGRFLGNSLGDPNPILSFGPTYWDKTYTISKPALNFRGNTSRS